MLLPIFSFLYDKYKFDFRCNLPSEVLVTKVIDGDTILVEGGKTIRLLGIGADEKGYSCYESAKIFLENLVLNKKVKLEKRFSKRRSMWKVFKISFFKWKKHQFGIGKRRSSCL